MYLIQFNDRQPGACAEYMEYAFMANGMGTLSSDVNID